MSKNNRDTKKNGFLSFLTGLLVLAVTVGIAFGVAALWQTAEDASEAGEELPLPTSRVPEPSSVLAESSSAVSIAVIVPQTASSASAESSEAASEAPSAFEPVSSIPESSSTAPAGTDEPGVAEPDTGFRVRPEYSYALPQNPKKVTKSYFDDALFFGDSLSVGIPLYHVMDNTAVIAFQGINPININTKEAVDVKGDGNRVTMLNAAKAQYPDRKKVYIMLGGNGLDLDEESFISGYKTFLQSVKQAYPGAKIFIQTMTPVTDNAHLVYPSVSNEKIDRYNLAIMALAQEEKVYFVDVAAALMNAEGKLPLEASPADGMHIGGEYYHKWFDYLMSHTVEE